jgi:Mg-chelatase subunit ChlD/DNA-binding beta-propeller fold protein YncE
MRLARSRVTPLTAPTVPSRLVCVGLVTLLAGTSLLAGPAQAQAPLPEAYRVVETWPARPQPRPAGELTAPAGLDTAPDGTVYIADAGAHDIHALDATGRGLRVIGGPGGGPGQLAGPRDVTWDGGRLYVADTGNSRVQVLDPATGVAVAQWTGLGRPWSVDLTAERAYVSDEDRPLVHVTDRGGARLASWGPGQAVDLPFVTPRGLSVGPDGTLYVADPGAGGVHVVRADGELVRTLDRGDPNPSYRAPWDVAADAEAVYAVVRRQLVAWQFPQGLLPLPRPGQGHYGAQGLALGPGQGLVVTEVNDRTAFAGAAFYEDRNAINRLPERYVGTVPVPLGSLDGPSRLVAAPDGGAWLLDSWPRVQRWGPGGAPLHQLRAEGLVDLARAPGEDLYLVSGDEVRRVGPDGSERWRWAAEDEGVALVAAAADGGDLFAVDAGRSALRRWSVDGAPSSVALIGTVVDLAVAGGVVAVLDRSAGLVRRLDAGGNELARWPAPWRPQRLAAGLDGSAWFVLAGDGTVWKHAPDGQARAAWAGAPAGQALDLDVDRRGRVLVADGEADRVWVHALDPAGQGTVPPPPGGHCELRPTKTAQPGQVRLGQQVTVTLALAGGCPAESVPLDLVLALDRSGSMAGPKLAGAQAAAIDFTTELDFADTRVGVVAFNQGADLAQPLTDDRSDVVRAVAGLLPAGLTNLAAPVETAMAELTGPRGRPGVPKVLVLMTDGRPEGSTPEAARAAAEAARAAGLLVYAIGLGGDVDGALLADMAGAPERYFQAPTAADLARIYGLIAKRLVTTTLLRTITVTDLVPANMRYVPGSAVPPASWDGTALRWTFTEVPADGFRLTYRLEPRDAGRWPTNVRADGDYVDGLAYAGRVTFPVPFVDVVGRAWVYLPILYKSRCPQQRSDIVLVIDASSSMLESSPGGSGTKLDAARTAARGFLAQLGLPQDQAAVVAFHREPQLAQPLTGDRAALERAIAGFGSGVGTRIDRGLAAARQELASARRRPGNLPVVVLLTDGQPDGGTASAARAEARALREAGVALFTIGLGATVDGLLLTELAGDPLRYRYAPGQDDLRAIYQSIAWSLPCE